MDQKYVFHILIDDAHGANFFKILLEEPEVMPTIKKYIYDQGAHSKNCLASYVASSIPGHTVLLTGVFSNRNNVPYAWYWDIQNEIPKKMDLSKIGISTIKKWNKTISKDIKTTFEHVPDSASFTVISRGAKLKFFTVWKIIWAFIILKLKRVDLLESELGFWEYMYLTQVKKLLQKIRKKGLPNYSFIVYPPSDSAAHKYGFDSQQYRDTLNLIDRVVKLLIEGDHSDPAKPVLGLKDMGYFDDCMFVICSDHSSKKFEKLSDILADVQKLPLNVISVNAPKIKKSEIQAADLLVAPGSGIYMFYARASNTTDYSQYPTIEQLQAYLKEEKGESINLLGTILNAEGTARAYIHTSEDSVMVLEPSGSRATITRKMEEEKNFFKYELEGTTDPLGYQGNPKMDPLLDGNFHGASDWFASSIHTQYPFQVDQIFRYMDCGNVGNIIAEAKRGWNYVATGLEDEEAKVQTHDTCDRDETIVPLIISGNGVKKGFEIPYCRNVDIIPTFLDWLKLGYDPTILDGRPLKEIFSE
jgi:hypothetical protein